MEFLRTKTIERTAELLRLVRTLAQSLVDIQVEVATRYGDNAAPTDQQQACLQGGFAHQRFPKFLHYYNQDI